MSKVKRVREKIHEEAELIYQEYRAALKLAVGGGQYEAAIKGYHWLIGHIPADEDGVRLVDGDVDKPKQVEGHTGPIINIGLKLGGLEKPKELTEKIININARSSEDE